jgi:hypothetical protein
MRGARTDPRVVFDIATLPVTTATTATITAMYNAVNRTAVLTVTATAAGPLAAPTLIGPASDARFAPGQTVTFDWSDVSGAATYTIQTDDQDSFPSPLIVGQTVTSSQFSSATLPTKTMWWRARANDAAGTPGAWSATRRFEVKK